jgi:hypothetical protein
VREDAPRSLARLVAGVIDYAGLFPPAALPMTDAVERYAGYRRGPHAWMLGRFIVPAARLAEFARALDGVGRADDPPGPWPLSVLAEWPLTPSLQRIRSFAAAGPAAFVASIEGRAASAEAIHSAAAEAKGFELFAEVPLTPVPAELLDAAAGAGCAVKIRTGGTTPADFPASDAVAGFLAACVGRGLPFKATAGLHHPVRSPHPVTYEARAPRATMHGFLNVFLGSALLHARALDLATAANLLEETDPSAFAFWDDRAGWRGHWVTTAHIEAARGLARSFGSCSFEEPVGDLAALALLHPRAARAQGRTGPAGGTPTTT